MPTYGPWQDGRIHEVFIHAPFSTTESDFFTTFGQDGIEFLSGSAWPGWGFRLINIDTTFGPVTSYEWTAGASAIGPDAILPETPGWGTTDLSACCIAHMRGGSENAWDTATGACLNIAPENGGNALGSPLVGWEHHGTLTGSGHDESWKIRAVTMRLGYYLPNTLASVGVAPPVEEWPANVDYVDIGTVEEFRHREVLEFEVRPWDHAGVFKAWVKQPGDPGLSWLNLGIAGSEGEFGSPDDLTGYDRLITRQEAVDLGEEAQHGVRLNIEAAQAIVDDAPDKTTGELNSDPLLPRVGFEPGDIPLNMASTEESFIHEIDFVVYLKFRTPRWRYAFEELPPEPSITGQQLAPRRRFW